MNQNPSRKITRKLEIEIPITFVDRNHNDNGHVRDPDLIEAALLCHQSTAESGSRTSVFFVLFRIMSNTMQNIVDKFDWREQPNLFLW